LSHTALVDVPLDFSTTRTGLPLKPTTPPQRPVGRPRCNSSVWTGHYFRADWSAKDGGRTGRTGRRDGREGRESSGPSDERPGLTDAADWARLSSAPVHFKQTTSNLVSASWHVRCAAPRQLL